MGTVIPPPVQAQTTEVAEPVTLQTQKRPVKLTGKPALIEEFLARFDVCISRFRGEVCAVNE